VDPAALRPGLRNFHFPTVWRARLAPKKPREARKRGPEEAR